MNTAFHMDEQRTLVHVPDKEEMTIGRSTRADYRIKSMGVSSCHVYLKKGKNAQGASIFMATDIHMFPSTEQAWSEKVDPRRRRPPCPDRSLSFCQKDQAS